MIVVGGLPRSGTSMMMAMLDAAGIPCVRDETHGPLENYETIKAIMGDWELEDLYSWSYKAVKILDALPKLPPIPVSVIVMRRTNSDYHQTPTESLDRIRLWCADKKHIEVWYEDVLADPERECKRVAALLRVPLDISAMAKVVVGRRP